MKNALFRCCLGVAGLAASDIAKPTMPEGMFACHVVTGDGRDGLVVVQADSRERARIVATGARAFTAGTLPAVAVQVVECLPRRGADFASDAANRLRDRLIQ